MGAKPSCPQCGRKKAVTEAGGLFRCTKCGALFDEDPDEGGTHSDRNPAARMEREERRRANKTQHLRGGL